MNNNDNQNPQEKILNNLGITGQQVEPVVNTNELNVNIPPTSSVPAQPVPNQSQEPINVNSIPEQDILNMSAPKESPLDEQDTININNFDNNKFIVNNQERDTSLSDLQTSNDQNQLTNNYVDDPKVKENTAKKNTITITSEGKVFIIIIIVLLLFTFVMPYIFDALRDIIYH